MKEYYDFVEELAANKVDKVFFNSGPIHAAIVMSKIFQYSKKEVLIFCGGFTGAVSNNANYLSALEGFLSKDETTLKVVVEDYEKNKNSKVYSLLKKYSSRVSIVQTKSRVLDTSTEQFIHFTVGDDSSLRIETNPSDFTAQVNFKSPDAKEYVDLFMQLFNNKANHPISLS